MPRNHTKGATYGRNLEETGPASRQKSVLAPYDVGGHGGRDKGKAAKDAVESAFPFLGTRVDTVDGTPWTGQKLIQKELQQQKKEGEAAKETVESAFPFLGTRVDTVDGTQLI